MARVGCAMLRMRLVAAAAALLVAGCTSGGADGDAPGTAAESAATDDSTDPFAPAGTLTTSTDVDVAADPAEQCRLAQHHASGPGLSDSYYSFASRLFESPTGSDRTATARWQHVLDRIRDKAVADGCPDPPPEMRQVLRVSNASGNLRVTRLSVLIPAMLTWTHAIDLHANYINAYLHEDAYCVAHRGDVLRATYTVESVPTASGQDVWLDLAIENLTSGPVYGIVDGHMRVVGSTDHQQRGRADWGGSGGDEYGARAHSTIHKPLLDVVGYPFHLTSAGHLEDIHVSTVASSRGHECTYPARPGS